jgi:glycerophosphoryl diester phosphodiesterase
MMTFPVLVRPWVIGMSLLVLLNCSGQTTSENNTPPRKTLEQVMKTYPNFDLQGHRGARGLLPENTIISMLEALRYNITTLELDLVVSADSQLVVSHEPWFNHEISSHPDGRPVSAEEARSLNIFEMNYEQVKRFDVGRRGNPRFPQQMATPAIKPVLWELIADAETFRMIQNRPTFWYNIEMKSDPSEYGQYYPQPDLFARLLHNELTRMGILERVVIQSFDVRALQEMQKIDKEIPLSLLVENENGLEWNLSRLGFTPAIYSPYFELIDENLVKQVQQRGMKLIPWTINEEADMLRMINLGVDGLITDYPDRANALGL